MKTTTLFGLLVASMVMGCYGGIPGDLGSATSTLAENPEDFPPWLRPYIRPVAIMSSYIVSDSNPLPADEMIAAVVDQCDCLHEKGVGFEQLLKIVDAQFALQHANLTLNDAMACSHVRGTKATRWDSDDPPKCGNEPRGPFPPRWWDLIAVQVEVYLGYLPELFDLRRDQVTELSRSLGTQLESFEKFREQSCR
jgi:hypothetical protein